MCMVRVEKRGIKLILQALVSLKLGIGRKQENAVQIYCFKEMVKRKIDGKS